MPSFRLGKHTNRSQHGIGDQLATAASPSASNPSSTSPSASAANNPSNPLQPVSSQPLDALNSISADQSSSQSPPSFSARESVDQQQQQQQLSSAPPTTNKLQKAPPPHQQQQQQPPPLSQPPPHQHPDLQLQHQAPVPPPHLYNPASASSPANPAINNSSSSGILNSLNQPQNPQQLLSQPDDSTPGFVDGHQVISSQDPSDPAFVNRSQSARFPPVHPPPPHGSFERLHLSAQQQQQHQHQQELYGVGVASGSLDDLPSPNSYQQQQQQAAVPPQPQPSKRSARNIIKGIFGGGSSSKNNDEDQRSHSSYDNTSGLARRPSKRVSNSHTSTATNVNRPIQPSSIRRTNTLPVSDPRELDTDQPPNDSYYTPLEPRSPFYSQDSRITPINTARQVSNVSNPDFGDTSPYEDAFYHQPKSQQPPAHQLQSPHPGDHPGAQDQQLHFDQQQTHYDNIPTNRQPGQAPLQQSGYAANINTQQDLFGRQQDPRAAAPGHLGPAPIRPPNAETASQLSHESPITETDPRNQQPPAIQPSPGTYYTSTQQNQDPTPGQQQQLPSLQTQHPAIMAPGGTPASATRRVPDAEAALRGAQVEPPPGPPPGYRPSNSATNPTSSLPPQAGSTQNPAYRERDAHDGNANLIADQGRNSPQPSTSERESEDKNKELVTKYKHVKRLYFDGKKQIETLQATVASLQDSVSTLQDAVANQRMSQSRTALDDSEYSTRFTRLNGAIKDLSFNIRKDWKTVPSWVDPYLSPEALKTAKQEMTAVGRAVISRWLFEEIFNKCFHPGLDVNLSAQLKELEHGIRGNTHVMSRQEEFDALTTKIVNWRMATLDGLQRKLDVKTTTENRALFVSKASTNLAAFLQQHNATPVGSLEGSTTTIVEIAIGIAANLPLESRDVAITYPLPGDAVRPDVMEVDQGALPSPSEQKDNDDEDDDEERSKLLIFVCIVSSSIMLTKFQAQ